MSKNGAPTSLKDELKAWSKRGGKPSTYTRAAHSSVASESSGGSASSYLSSRKVRRKRPPFSSVSFSRNAADGEGPLSSSSSANPQGGSVQEDAGTTSEVSHVNAQVVVLPNISEDATREASDSSDQHSRDNGATAGDHSESQEKSYIDASASGRAEKGAENLDPTVYVPDKGEDLSDVSEISANPASSRESNVGLDATNEQEDLVADVMDDSVSSEKAQCSRQERSLPDPMDDHAYVRGSRKSSSTKRDVCGTVYTGMPERWEYDAPRHSLPGVDLAMREDLAHRPLPSIANRSVSAPSSRVHSQGLAQSYSPRREAPRSLSLYARAKPTKEPMKSRVQSARPPSTRQTSKSFFRGSLNRSRSADIDRRGRSSSRGSERSNSRLKSLLSRRRNAGDCSSSQCSSGSQDSTSARMRLVKKLFSKPNKIKRSESSEALLRISSNNWRRNSGDLTFDSSRVSSSTWDEGSMNVFTGGRDGISRRMPNAEDHARLYRDLADDRATAEEIRFASKARENTLTKVVDLPWVDFKTKLHGRFSGPVDARLRPHGDGSLILQGNPFLVFYGTWRDGNLVSPLLNEDEKKEREVAAARGSAKRPISVMPHSRTDLPNSLGGRARRTSDASLSDRSSSKIPASNSSFCSLSDTRRQPSGSSGSRATAGRRKKRNPRLYKLGEVCRSPSDMIIYRSNRDAINSASLLDKMDQAFLKRSTGLWTCAVLAERSLQPQLKGIKNHWFTSDEIEDLPNNVEMEESLLFVIDEDGATKIVKRKHWGRFVRRMANKDASKLTKHGRAFRELEDSSCCQSDC
ncbi:hypothetical protein THAOC_13629 [Thalassiosira oceanica]|uniref:Uncharacterized protein n=1 Tax=Thalassiosira oceanica TaxID=159749 RepID=K0SWX0_THAOC|nr:hypothetical protein THAOC_13629 [Thalassiosira oceanica]|eukprot:EJK65496.1 hypothetical protein THAOC_13629 [Thalassiosira oceanica]